MGWLCSDTAELGYAGVRVPAANLVGAEGGGFGLVMAAVRRPSGWPWRCTPTPSPTARWR